MPQAKKTAEAPRQRLFTSRQYLSSSLNSFGLGMLIALAVLNLGNYSNGSIRLSYLIASVFFIGSLVLLSKRGKTHGKK